MINKWYIAAQEVVKTLKSKHAGTFQESALFKGTKTSYRELAKEFVTFLRKNDILIDVKKSSRSDYYIVKMNKIFKNKISRFADQGIFFQEIIPFFKKNIVDFDNIRKQVE